MFHWPSHFPVLPSASEQVQCQPCVIWPEHRREKAMLASSFLRFSLPSLSHAILCLQLCFYPNILITELLNRPRINRNYISRVLQPSRETHLHDLVLSCFSSIFSSLSLQLNEVILTELFFPSCLPKVKSKRKKKRKRNTAYSFQNAEQSNCYIIPTTLRKMFLA